MNRTGSVLKYSTKSGKSRRSGEGTNKRGELWRYRFDGDPVDGKRRQVSAAGFATRAAAIDAMRRAIEAYEHSQTVERSLSLGDWIRVWFRDYGADDGRKQRTPKTLERYQQLASYILDAGAGEPAALAACPLAEVTHAKIEAALYALRRGKGKRVDHLSEKSVREIAGVLSVCLKKAFKLSKIENNPMLRVELPSVQRSETRSLTPEEVQTLRQVCTGDWTFTFIELALATGARRGELLALRWTDVEWQGATLLISKSVEETDSEGLRVKSTKSGKSRKFRIGPTAIEALRFQRETQAQYKRLCGDKYQDNGLVFCNPDGSYFLPHLVSQTIRRRMKKAAIADASLHTLRHTHASILISKGVPPSSVSARLGHADMNTTLRIYAHAIPADDDRSVEAWEKTISGPVQ